MKSSAGRRADLRETALVDFSLTFFQGGKSHGRNRQNGPGHRFFVVVVLLIIFGGGAMTGATMSGGMMGSGTMGGISWMWIPTLLTLGIGILLGWALFGKK